MVDLQKLGDYQSGYFISVVSTPMIKDIEPLDSTSLNVSWWPLRGVYGELDRYEVSYQPFEVETGRFERVQFPANATFGILKDLMPNIRYRIRIQAFAKSSPAGLIGTPSAFSFDRFATTKMTGKSFSLQT